MIKTVALYIFGWRRTPERFVELMSDFFVAHMRDHGVAGSESLSKDCCRSLSQLAYIRAKKESDCAPRFIHYARELEAVAQAVEEELRGKRVRDDRVRSILAWHRAKEEPNQAPEPTTTSVTPRAPSSTSRAGCGRGSS